MAFNIPKGLQQLHGKKSAKPEAGWCKSLPTAAVPLEDVLRGQANGRPVLTHPLVPKASAVGHSAEAWGGGCQQQHWQPITTTSVIFFWGSSPSWSQSSTLPKPQNQFGGFSKACLCSKSQWRDGMSFIVFPSHATCGVPCPHSKIWCWHHIQLVTSNMHFHPYTSLVPPSVQRVKTGSCSRRRLESI